MSSVKVVLPTLDLNQIDNPLAKVVIKGNKQFTTNTLNADTESANQVLFSFQLYFLTFTNSFELETNFIQYISI